MTILGMIAIGFGTIVYLIVGGFVASKASEQLKMPKRRLGRASLRLGLIFLWVVFAAFGWLYIFGRWLVS